LLSLVFISCNLKTLSILKYFTQTFTQLYPVLFLVATKPKSRYILIPVGRHIFVLLSNKSKQKRYFITFTNPYCHKKAGRNSVVCIHTSVICKTTGPQPLPKRFLHLMRSTASSFKREYPLCATIQRCKYLNCYASKD
jgi:hypothetical protein